jgi:methionyl-tRNA formyltransferase
MSPLRIVYIGCVEFSSKALRKLIFLENPPVGIITKKESIFNSDFNDLSEIAIEYSIPFKYVNNVNHSLNIEWIKSKNPDVIFCFGWSNLIGKEILSIPRLGVIGYHPALLPYNKGRHPIIWALVLGLTKTASTFFFMDSGADTGDILSQKEVEISQDDDARSLYDKITETGVIQIAEFTNRLKSGKFDRIKQPLGVGNSWRRRTQKDGVIDFRMTSERIRNLVRALTRPYVGAHLELNAGNFIVWKVEIDNTVDQVNIEPGKVLEVQGSKIKVKCAEGSVWLIEHELQEISMIGDYLI